MMHSEYKWLDRIDSPDDLKKLSGSDLRQYCDELRQYIIEQCSSNPGHLASSLGAVELAVALHYVFNTPDDKIVWDVGHQTMPIPLPAPRGVSDQSQAGRYQRLPAYVRES